VVVGGKSAWHFWLAAWNAGELLSTVEEGEAGAAVVEAGSAGEADEAEVEELGPPKPRAGRVIPLSFMQLW
jgi:hypothetical protein